MADYNVNMKQWNGTSFDNVLPLAYNAKQLGGQSLAEVKQWVQDNGLMLYTGQYKGTGTYGQSKPTTLTFPFEPIIIFMPAYLTPDNRGWDIIQTNMVADSYWEFYNTFDSGRCYIKSSIDRKTFSLYASDYADNQYNRKGEVYYFAAIGGYDMGGRTEWTITSSGTWTVPRTGRYMLELYGMGGKRASSGGKPVTTQGGGASCQHYDSITLTKGDSVPVVIGNNNNPSTSFGSYSVANGGDADSSKPGIGTGNRGRNGGSYTAGVQAQQNTYGTGTLSQLYGWGAGHDTTPGPGAVYLKYLGA